MRAPRKLTAALAGGLLLAVLVGAAAGGSSASATHGGLLDVGDTIAPVLTATKVKPKVLPAASKALVVVRSSESARLTGSVLLKQDGHWNRTSIEREWGLDQGRNELTFLTRAEQSLLVEGKYRLRLRAVDDAGNKSPKVILEFRVDLRH